MQLNRTRKSDSEIAREAQSKTRGGALQRPRGSGWDRLKRLALTGFGVLGTGALLGLAACPADLANPKDYDHAGSLTPGGASSSAGAPSGGSATGGAGGGSAQPGLSVNTGCLTTLFNKSCVNAACHQAPATFAAHLDLGSPNVNTRLIDVPATHESADPNTGCVANQKLIDSANPAQSWLLQKLSTDGKTCGLLMPIGAPLTSDEIACVTTYTNNVAAAAKAGGM